MKKNRRFRALIIFALLVVSLLCTVTVFADEETGETTEEPVLTGWQEIDGETYYYKSTGKPAKGLVEINDKYYFFDSQGRMQTGWQTAGGELRFFLESGEMAVGLTETEKGTFYYFNGKGLKKTGLYKLKGAYYYFDPETGKAVSKKLVTVDGDKYYFAKNCQAVTGWKTVDGKKYYFNQYTCKALKSSLQKLGGYWYAFGKNGYALTGWRTYDGHKYYFDTETCRGYVYVIKKIGSYYFLFNKSGHMINEGWYTIDGEKYYVNPKTHHAYAGVIRKIGGKQYGFMPNAKLAQGWQTIEGKKRYFLDDGQLAESGVVLINKKPYQIKNKGETYQRITRTGIYNGKYVIVKSNGQAVTGNGWTKYNGYKYYFEKDGFSIRMDTSSLTKGDNLILKVNKKRCMVTVLAYDKATKSYCKVVKSFVCSPGEPTPLGIQHLTTKHRWIELVGPTFGQWGCRYNGSKFFHSVYYDEKNDNNTLNVRAYNKLGTICSHGCIRLEAKNAKWVYEHFRYVKYVNIYESSNAGPFGKLSAVKLPSWHTWDPTDPNMHDKCEKRGCH